MKKTIDPLRLASCGESLQGEVALSALTRVSSVLQEQPSNQASYCLDFSQDEQGRAVVNGRIQASVVLECQRCGQAVEIALDLNPHLMVVHSDDQAKQIPKEFEPLMVGVEPVTLNEVLEEELLLALPMVPRHEEGECPVDLPGYLS
ncbi:MAG: YceD family protein [Coxiellaceae bacterium]|nr:YceD family protein [Coxiellaceae bacterium]